MHRPMSRSALTKLQVVLLIDLLVVASAGGAYLYIQSIPPPQLDPAQIQLVELSVEPTEATLG